MHPEVEKTSRHLMSKGDILSKLPNTNNTRNFDRAISFHTCQHYKCNAACTSTTVGYCQDHFVDLYRKFSLEIPTIEDIQNFQYKMDKHEESLHNVSDVPEKQQHAGTMFNRTDNRNCGHNPPQLPSPNKGMCQRQAENRGQCQRLEENNTYFVLNLNQDDLIESAAPTSESYRRNSKANDTFLAPNRCIGPTCYNYGRIHFKGLCESCYNILLHFRGDTQGHKTKESISIVSSSQVSDQTIPEQPLGDLGLKLPEEFTELNLSENDVDPASHALDFNERESHHEPVCSIEVVPCETRYLPEPSEPSYHRFASSVHSQYQPSRHLNYEQPSYATGYTHPSQHLGQRQLADLEMQHHHYHHQHTLPHQSVQHNDFTGRYQPSNMTTPHGNRSCSNARTESCKTGLDFKQVAKNIEENSRRSLKKCKKSHCSNYGNSHCQGYCNGCYKALK